MKKGLKIIGLAYLFTLVLTVFAYTTVEVIDNRDYPDDARELYFLGEVHIGYIYENSEVEFVLTGK